MGELAKRAIELESDNPDTYHRYAESIAPAESNLEFLTRAWGKAIELDPLNGFYRYGLGKAVFRFGDEMEGRRQLALAREIEPDRFFLAIDAVLFLDKQE